MSTSEWAGIALQVLVNASLLIGAASRMRARLAVIETRIEYIERGLHAHVPRAE
ncbi:hypothetical protein [Comamonas sp. GB3 AK4-5]|uniref:hypothetical protein n=1 Tax=Comamonas sp. GB3 AK4-5 TaxID=3231487 RepID=UPI00351EF19C